MCVVAMSLIYKIYCRLFHFGMKLFVLLFPFKRPKLYEGDSGFSDWLTDVKQQKVDKLLLVTDNVICELNILEPYLQQLSQHKIDVVIYSEVQPNPVIAIVEQGVEVYQQHQCQGILAVGGGSPMDCAKLIGARLVKPNKSVKQLKGLFKVMRKLPPLFAIPTTAGTGSETTIAAVVSDPDVKKKYAITDVVLAPDAAILLPELTKGLPPHISAATGIDALTHAIESYIGLNGTRFTNQRALAASSLIFENLQKVYEDGTNIEARGAMLKASFYAGEAFTRASVGYVHAIAHQLGALYNTPHGLANAIILPKMLRWFGSSIEQKLADICDAAELADKNTSNKEKAEKVISTIESLNKTMAIPTVVKEIQNEHVSVIVEQAMSEAHPLYPVPKFMSNSDCEAVVRSLMV